MAEFIAGEGLFSLRAALEGALPQGEGMYATWTDAGAPIIMTPSLSSNIETKAWNISKYGNPARWYITKPGEDKTQGFHYDRAEVGFVVSLGYPSPFFLEPCGTGTGGIFRPIDRSGELASGSNYCLGVSEKGMVEIMDETIITDGKLWATPAWQAHVIPGWWSVSVLLPDEGSRND